MNQKEFDREYVETIRMIAKIDKMLDDASKDIFGVSVKKLTVDAEKPIVRKWKGGWQIICKNKKSNVSNQDLCRLQDILAKFPLNKEIHVRNIWDEFGLYLDIEANNPEEFFGIRSEYSNSFYNPLKVLQGLGIVIHKKCGIVIILKRDRV